MSEAKTAWTSNPEWWRRGLADHAEAAAEAAEAMPNQKTEHVGGEDAAHGRRGYVFSNADPYDTGRQTSAGSASSIPVPADVWLALTVELARLREDVSALRADASKAPPADSGKVLADVLLTLEAQRAEREDAAERRRAGRVAVVVACAFGLMFAALATALVLR